MTAPVGNEQQKAFESIKKSLMSTQTLACSDFSVPFKLPTDASTVGLGAVLSTVTKY